MSLVYSDIEMSLDQEIDMKYCCANTVQDVTEKHSSWCKEKPSRHVIYCRYYTSEGDLKIYQSQKLPSGLIIGHFRVALKFIMKARLSAKFLL